MSPAPTVEVKSFRCPRCILRFPDQKLVSKHSREEHPKCKQCRKTFSTKAGLQTHKQATDHCYCHECDILFTTPQEHLNHVRSVTHATLHHCCDCDREYANQDTLSLHCCDCDKTFRSRHRMKMHLSNPEHIHKVEVLESQKTKNLPNKCKHCDETFHHKKQLRKHVSSTHKHIRCPVGKKCKKFATPSALLSHLESGRCSSGLTRTKMHELVFAHDSNRYITSIEAADTIHSANNIPGNAPSPLPPAADDDSLSEWSEVGGAILTPTTSESDWSLIGRNVLTPTHSDNASQWSTMSEDLVHISSNTFPSATNLETSSHSAQPQGLRCHLCRPDRKPFVRQLTLPRSFIVPYHSCHRSTKKVRQKSNTSQLWLD
ncbi:zinc finger protein [Rutstroemia sp. NJR-2017a BBW]|nr:zinc finger protein [Rutstroemia sp. NJR-2017a BBW]